MVDTNLTGAFLMAQLAARSMAAAGGGAIVLDESGGDGPFAADNASKAALLGLNRTMALSWPSTACAGTPSAPSHGHRDDREGGRPGDDELPGGLTSNWFILETLPEH